jgi:hypothetical protein
VPLPGKVEGGVRSRNPKAMPEVVPLHPLFSPTQENLRNEKEMRREMRKEIIDQDSQKACFLKYA